MCAHTVQCTYYISIEIQSVSLLTSPRSHPQRPVMGASSSIVGGKEELLRRLSQYEELKAEGASHDEIYSKLSENLGIENKTDHIDHETEMRARGEKLIFISINVSTMLKSARILQTELEKQGYRVWVCTDMVGGVDFRDSIVQAVKQCHIFISNFESWKTIVILIRKLFA